MWEEQSSICGETLKDNLTEAEVLLSTSSRAIALWVGDHVSSIENMQDLKNQYNNNVVLERRGEPFLSQNAPPAEVGGGVHLNRPETCIVI